jgi:arylsulfatase A-like enzyme
MRNLLAYLALASLVLVSCNTDQEQITFKNVIVLVGDDHTVNALGCYGNDIIRTPNLDRIAANGVRFTNAYSNAPLCSASRQSLLTGKLPHASGVTLLRTPFRDETNITIAEHLRDRGFRTAIIGKTHFNNFMDSIPPDHGFDVMVEHTDWRQWHREGKGRTVPDSIQVLPQWKPFQDPARIWLNADVLPTSYYEEEGTAAWDAKHAIEFLRENKDDRFLLWVGFHEPHSPFNFPVDYAGKYDPDDMPLPEGSPEDDRWVPSIFRDLSDEDKRGIIASYYTSAEYMDNNVGKVLDEVDKLGLTENTLIIYIGDQGYLLGDHKRFEKHSMWDPAVKAPMLLQMGGKSAGETREALVEFIDLAPTILELLGIDPMEEVQGESLVPVINKIDHPGKEYVFAEFMADNKAMVCDGEWKYVYTTGKNDLGQGYSTGLGPSGILHKLYNIKTDPDETRNVAGDPGNAAILHRLQQEMINIFLQTHPYADSLPAGKTVDDTLSWFCEPMDVGVLPGEY